MRHLHILKKLCLGVALASCVTVSHSYTQDQEDDVYQSLLNYEWQPSHAALLAIAPDVDKILLSLYAKENVSSNVKLRVLLSLQYFPSEALQSFYMTEIQTVQNSLWRKKLFDLYVNTFSDTASLQAWLALIETLDDDQLNKHVAAYQSQMNVAP